MKGVSVVLVVCGMSSGFAAPAGRVGRLGLVLGPQGLASTGIEIGSVATNMGTGLASQTLGAMGSIPMLGPFAQIGRAAVETGNDFAQMAMGMGHLAVSGFGGPGNAAALLQLAGRQQFGAQLATQQQLAAQLEAQHQLAAQLGARQQLAAQMAAQQTMHQAAAQQPTAKQVGAAQQGASGKQQTENLQDILSSPELDSWWNPAPPQPMYIGN